MNALKRALKQLKKTRNITRSTTRDRLPSDDELIKLTAYFYRKWQNGAKIPMHLVMWFAIYSARRQGEITHLKLSDDLGEYFVVRDVKNPKGSLGNHKKFTVSSHAYTLIELLKTHSSDGNYLVPASPKMLSKSFSKACLLLGIDDLHFHDLRHESCTRLAELGLSIPQTQGYSLHDSWSSFARYVSVHRRGTTLHFDNVMNAIADGRV